MALRLAVLKNVFNSYHTKAYPLQFLFFVILYLILKGKNEQRNLLIYEIFGILLLVTPFIGNKIVTLGAEGGSNWPVYGILCVLPLTAYIATDLIWQIPKRKEKGIFLLALFFVIQLGLGVSVTGEQFLIPKNLEKTSNLTLQIGKALEVRKKWCVIAPIQIAGDLCEYDENIKVIYDTEYENLQADLIKLQSKAKDLGCNCIILEDVYDSEEIMSESGYEKLADIKNYIIYVKRD